MTVRVRQNVYDLPDGDTTLEWYSKAVAAMRGKPSTDPTSWNYQAAIHGIDFSSPFWTNVGAVPSPSEQAEFWNQCQHGSWYFLPWHRMYLAYFEQIVAQTIVDLGGPEGWSLPYWDYSDTTNPDHLNIPPAFTSGTPDTNPLQMPSGSNGEPGRENTTVDEKDTQLTALNLAIFTSQSPFSKSGFGGPKTSFSHDSGTFGGLENLPHNPIHVDIGNAMGDPATAGLDPIFWLHHANIDRLWQVWLDLDPQHSNPSDPQWLSYAFDFHDSSKQAVSMVAAQVLDTTKVLSGYVYQADHTAVKSEVWATSPLPLALKPDTDPEILAASNQITNLSSVDNAVRLDFLTPNRRRASMHSLSAGNLWQAAPSNSSSATEVYLNFENVKGTGRPPVYDVYLQSRDATGKDIELYAGPLAFFGLAAASRPSTHHSGSGQHHVLDISSQIYSLRASTNWDGSGLQIRLHPRKALASDTSVNIGRISLYVK